MTTMRTWVIFAISSVIEISIASLYAYEAIFVKYVPIFDNLASFYLLIVYTLAIFFAVVFTVDTKDFELESSKNQALFELQKNRQSPGGKFRRIVGVCTDVLIVISVALTSPIKAALLGTLLSFILSVFNTAIKKATEPSSEVEDD